jgi:hypothetical protein
MPLAGSHSKCAAAYDLRDNKAESYGAMPSRRWVAYHCSQAREKAQPLPQR